MSDDYYTRRQAKSDRAAVAYAKFCAILLLVVAGWQLAKWLWE